MTADITFTGIDGAELAAHLATGTDAAGNPIEAFTVDDDGWTLRCCLRDSQPGDSIAIIAWSPFPWDGPYRETGPIVVHASACPGHEPMRDLPPEIEDRAMVLRPYNHDRRIAYDHVTHVGRHESVSAATRSLLDREDIAFVHGRNVTGGCYAFTAEAAEAAE